MLDRVVESKIGDVPSPFDRNRLDADAGRVDPGADFLTGCSLVDGMNQLGRRGQTRLNFDSGLKVFGILADDDQIDV